MSGYFGSYQGKSICVGAEPLALLDYVAVERADPAQLRELARGLKIGAGDALIGLPASGVHSNGLTLARRALLEDGD